MDGARKDCITVPYSKAKVILKAALCCIGIIMGIVTVSAPVAMAAMFHNEFLEAAQSNPMPLVIFPVMVLFGSAFAFFFAKTLIFILKKISSQVPAYIIDGRGIFIDTSMLFSGTVPWGDIRRIREAKTSARVMAVELNNPEKYINNEPDFLKRAAMRLRMFFTGSPVLITAGLAKISSHEMYNLLWG